MSAARDEEQAPRDGAADTVGDRRAAPDSRPEIDPDDENRFGERVRFACGFVAGLGVALELAVNGELGLGATILALVVTSVVFGVAATKLGGRFWLDTDAYRTFHRWSLPKPRRRRGR